MATTENERELNRLEAELRQLEAEYNMFFAGRLPKPPWETRTRVTALIKQLDRAPIMNTGERFRFSTIQSRYQAFIDLWDRGLRAREEGRSGPFAQKKTDPPAAQRAPENRVLHVAAFRDPLREVDKLRTLYDSLVEARKDIGEEAVPFHRFAELVKNQVQKLKTDGDHEVAFRVAVKDGKVSFTARALKGQT
ncbi:MAG TPA: MXAN_5187 C-terminal domain-containing protein [Vicinamibacterales bacterium]|jgi:hypothetical protein|nr:MXAN_5187 C-terminal domain-containing protein [Vicinamibacterales bacterium]